MFLQPFTKYIAALLLITTVAACGGGDDKKQQQGPPPPVYVTITDAKSTEAVYYDEYPAVISALNQIELRAQVSGYVTGMFFKDGQKVSKGQRLYTIDAQIYNANLQQAQANEQVQETNMMKAQKDADRYHELDAHDAIAKQQVDYADAALEAAKKQVAASKATIKSVRANVNFSVIYAPFSGTIGLSLVKTGTAVIAGQTILNTVSTDNPVAVDFAVDQKEVYRFVQAQQKGIMPRDSTFTIMFGTDIYPYPGHISVIDRAVDPQTGTIKTRLVFPNGKSMLKPGMNATVRVKNSGAQTIVIPNKAVTEQLGEFFVYVVGDSSKVSQRKVQLSRQLGSNIIVREGLKEGEKIVVEGVQKLREGSKITTAPPKAPETQKKP